MYILGLVREAKNDNEWQRSRDPHNSALALRVKKRLVDLENVKTTLARISKSDDTATVRKQFDKLEKEVERLKMSV